MIQLRQAKESDYDFCFLLKKATLKDYIAKTWGWDEQWQIEYHSQHFNPDLLKIITKSEQDIGCISIIKEYDYYILSLIEILPKFQNLGIGTNLIQKLLSDAKEQQKNVYLQVLISNKKAKKLYERLGFKIIEKTDTHYKMIYHS
ncbi:MAG: GNAT family N-acetyltransferase [Promethearchaeota archaeon]